MTTQTIQQTERLTTERQYQADIRYQIALLADPVRRVAACRHLSGQMQTSATARRLVREATGAHPHLPVRRRCASLLDKRVC